MLIQANTGSQVLTETSEVMPHRLQNTVAHWAKSLNEAENDLVLGNGRRSVLFQHAGYRR